MKRREFLKSTGMASAAVALGAAPPLRKQGPGSPNLLFIMTDQQFAGAMSCAGERGLRTPAMDALAASGVRFEKAYCSNPICVPARTTMFTGLMGHETGVDFNTDEVVPLGSCIGLDLKKAGYDTAYFGKWHVHRDLEDASWSGFDTVGFHKEKGADPRLAEPVSEFIRRERDRPFFAVASFMNPHNICEYARRLSGMEQVLPDGEVGAPPNDKLLPPLPTNFGIPTHEPSAIREHQSFPKMAGAYPVARFDELAWRRYRWAYFRMIEIVDREIGKILKALDDSGKRRDTLVVFTSDHGDGMGAHQWNQKTVFYEEVSRVPFILSRPGTLPEGKVDRTALVNGGIDLAPTLFGAAGLAPRAEFKGTDLSAVARGVKATLPKFVVSQTQLTKAYGVRGPATGRMVRSDRFKYVVFDHGADREQLFDLEKDSGEMVNLAVDPRHSKTLAAHREMLRGWIAERKDVFVLPA